MDMPPRRPTSGANTTGGARSVMPTGTGGGATNVGGVANAGEQRIGELQHKLRNAQQRCAMGDRMACMAVSQLSQSLAEAQRASQPKGMRRGRSMGQRSSGGGGGLGMSYGAARQMMLGGGG